MVLKFYTDYIRGDRLLEIGCGPSIRTVIPASRKYKHIYMSDYVKDNTLAVKSWLNRQPDAHDWTEFMKIFSDMEETRCVFFRFLMHLVQIMCHQHCSCKYIVVY